MSTFFLPGPWKDVEVKLPSNLTSDQLMAYKPFNNWLSTLSQSFQLQQDRNHVFHSKEERYSLRSIVVDTVDWFGPRIGFLKMRTEIRNESNPRPLDGVVFMRGGSVAVLMVLRLQGNEDERYVIMTQQPRVPAGSLAFFEIPAGMIDDSGTFKGAAAKEIEEETGLTVEEGDLIDMTSKALRNAKTEGHLQPALYPSPGGSDEYISLMAWEMTMSRMEL